LPSHNPLKKRKHKNEEGKRQKPPGEKRRLSQYKKERASSYEPTPLEELKRYKKTRTIGKKRFLRINLFLICHSGMALSIPLSVIPECFYQESKLFKDKNIWISDKRFRK